MYFLPSLDQALELLKQGNIDQVDDAMDHFVQFYINTKNEQETLTGNNHIFVTICANHESQKRVPIS